MTISLLNHITYIPIGLIYFNHRTMQYAKVSEALNGHGRVDSLATASSDNYHVGGGEGSLLSPGGTNTTDVLVLSLVCQYCDHHDYMYDSVSKCQDQ